MPRLYFFCILLLSTLSVSAQHTIQLVKPLKLSPSEPVLSGIEYNGKYVFATYSNLWISDGTENGTIRLMQGLRVQRFFKSATTLFLIAQGMQHGVEIWVTDGTEAGTKMVKDINTTSIGGGVFATAGSADLYDNELYFFGNDGTHGWEIWKSDGTEAGTVMIKDVNPNGDCFYTSMSGRMPALMVVNNKVFFSANDGVHGTELWTTDGTEAGTQMLVDLVPGQDESWPSVFRKLGNRLVFSTASSSSQSSFYKLMITDGTQNGTYEISGFADDNPEHVELNGQLYLIGRDTGLAELFITNGQAGNLQKLGQVQNYNVFNKAFLTVFNNKVYFISHTQAAGTELWETDGTQAGTKLAIDVYPYIINSNAYSSQPVHLTAFGNRLFFRATDTTGIFHIWASDGTAGGTKVIAYPPAERSQFGFAIRNQMHVVGSDLYIGAAWEKHGDTLQTTALYKMNLFPTAVEEVEHSPKLVLYPNPANNQISFSCNNAAAISLYSMSGTAVMKKELNKVTDHSVDIAGLPTGVYAAVVECTDGSKSTAIFVKQ